MSAGTAIYKFLHLEPTATTQEIKSAYRGLAMHLHPDHGGDPERFHKLRRAYELLSDPVRRAKWHKEHGLPPPNGQPEEDSPGVDHPPEELNWRCAACETIRYRCHVCDIGTCEHETFFVRGQPLCRECKGHHDDRAYSSWKLSRIVKQKFGHVL